VTVTADGKYTLETFKYFRIHVEFLFFFSHVFCYVFRVISYTLDRIPSPFCCILLYSIFKFIFFTIVMSFYLCFQRQ
jgi:hypothetical protein